LSKLAQSAIWLCNADQLNGKQNTSQGL